MNWYTSLQANITSRASNYLQLSTIYKNQPQVRTVVYRGTEVIQNIKYLIITTHNQSDKVNQLLENEHYQLCWYFDNAQQQFRISGTCTLLDRNSTSTLNMNKDDIEQLRSKYFNKTSNCLKVSFTWPKPNSLKQQELEYEYNDAMFDKAFNNFTLLLLKPDNIDWISLQQNNNKRLIFNRNQSEVDEWDIVEVNP